jgi:hypothetical protein
VSGSGSGTLSAEVNVQTSTPTLLVARLSRHHGALLAVCVYGTLALLAYLPSWPGDPNHLPVCGCGDQAQTVWFLRWTPFALAHWYNPWFSNYIAYPSGVNLAQNTTTPLLGVLTSPISKTFGPVASFTFLMWLGFTASATSCFFALRRWVDRAGAAFAGGLLYGFSPYVVAQGSGHINLMFVPIPPLILLFLDELIVRQRSSPIKWGIGLGLLMTAQFYVSSEIFITTALVALIGITILAISQPAKVRPHATHALRGLLWAAIICVPLIIEPVIFALIGPRSYITSSAHGTYPFEADLLGTFVPDHFQKIAPSGLVDIGNRLVIGVASNGSYLGIPLLVFMAYTAVRWWRLGVVRFAVGMDLIVWVLALGPRLTIDTRMTSIPLPYAILDHLPLVPGLVVARLSLYVDLFAALLLAVGLDRVRRSTRTSIRHQLPSSRVVTLTMAAIITLIATPLVPNWPYAEAHVAVPRFFNSNAAKQIPAGSVVLTYPFPDYPQLDAMLWQASDDMRFRILGGYALVPTAHRLAYYYTFPATLPAVPITLVGDYVGMNPSQVIPGTPRASPSDMRSFLVHYHVRTVIAERVGSHPNKAYNLFDSAIGARPVHIKGMDVWFNIPAKTTHSDS